MRPFRPVRAAAAMLALVFLASLLLAAPAMAAGGGSSLQPSLSIEGSVMHGVGARKIREGGATLVFHLSGPVTFHMPEDAKTELKRFVRDETMETGAAATSDDGNVGHIRGWNAQLDNIFGDGCSLRLSANKKRLTVTLGPAPGYSVDSVETVTARVPDAFFAATIGGGIHRQLRRPPTTFDILPIGRLSFSVDAPADAPPPTVMEDFTLRFAADSPGMRAAADARLVRNGDCSDPFNGVAVFDRFADDTAIRVRMKTGGERFNLCYIPRNPDEHNSATRSPTHATDSAQWVLADGRFGVVGPTDYRVVDAHAMQMGVPATVAVNGWRLTDEDTVALAPMLPRAGGNPFDACAALPVDTPDQSDVELSSTSRGSAVLLPKHAGPHVLCYLPSGATSFSTVGDGAVLDVLSAAADTPRRNDFLIDGIVRLRQDRLHIDQVTVVSGGEWHVESHHINASHFTWVGGLITGYGSVNIHKFGNVSGPSKVISFALHNYGLMVIHADHILFTGAGAIYNYGTIIIKLSDEVTSWTTDLSKQEERTHRFINMHGGTINVELTAGRGLSGAATTEQTLQLLAPVENRGHLVLSGHAKVFVKHIAGRAASTIEVRSFARLTLEGGEMDGASLRLRSDGHVAITSRVSTVALEKVTFFGDARSGVVFNVEMGNHHARLNGCRFSGNLYAYFASAPGSRILLEGYSQFDINTTVFLQSVSLEAPVLAYLDILGFLRWHVPSVRIGDHISVNAVFRAVLFGGGSSTDGARLLPQFVPNNSTFRIPRNATLVLLDTGSNRTMEHSPQLCSQYLVVPIHVILEGEAMVWGCVMFPFGGQQRGGIIFGVSAETIETTTKYAFCKMATSNGDGDAAPAAAGNTPFAPQTCIPLYPHQLTRSISGVITGGHHLVSAPDDGRRPSMEVDFFRAQDGGYTALTPIHLLVRHGIIVDDTAFLSVARGGDFTGTLLTVNGVLEVDAAYPFNVHGAVDVSGTLALIPTDDHCTFGLTVEDQLFFVGHSRVECASVVNASWGSTFGIATARRGVLGNPDTVFGCALVDSDSGVAPIMRPTEFGQRITDPEPTPSVRARLLAFVVCVCAASLLIGIFILRVGVPNFVTELTARTDTCYHLSWPEFSAFWYNVVAAFAILADAGFLSCVAFHPLLQLPHAFEFLTKWGNGFFALYPGSSWGRVSVVFESLFIVLWALAYIPLVKPEMKQKLRERENPRERYMVQLFFQLHTFLAWTATMLYVPIVSSLLDPVMCATILSPVAGCGALRPYAVPAGVALAVFVVLAPVAGSAACAPFTHPPYMRELDLRYKRVYIFLRSCLLLLVVAAWKILGRHLTAVVAVTFVLVAALFFLDFVAAPSAYANINLFKQYSLLFPAVGAAAAWVQILRGRTHFACAPADAVFVVMLVGGWFAAVVAMVVALRRAGKESVAYESIVNPAATIAYKGLVNQWEEMEENREKMYNSSSRREREAASAAMSQLRINYLMKLHVFRAEKEPSLLAYYLGPKLGAQVLHLAEEEEGVPHATPAAPGGRKSHRGHTGGGDSIASPTEMREVVKKHDRMGADELKELTAAQMTSYRDGPLLGRGTYGTVYMGILSTGHLVAVKLVPITRKQKLECLANVKKEVDVLRTLQHPNIVRYYGCHATKKQISIFMELATNGNLTHLVRKFGQLSEPVLKLYTRQMLSGLSYLHQKGVIHRDIKGENILIDGFGTLKLADFGCSKAFDDVTNRSQQGCASLVGSPYWMAPEVIRNEAYGTKADVWSLGCTVVEMLNGGYPPWHEKFDNVYSAMFFISNTTDLPSNIPSNVSAGCLDFLGRCFERDVSKRATVRELINHPWLRASGAEDPDGAGDDDDDGGEAMALGMGARRLSDIINEHEEGVEEPSVPTTLTDSTWPGAASAHTGPSSYAMMAGDSSPPGAAVPPPPSSGDARSSGVLVDEADVAGLERRTSDDAPSSMSA